MADISALEYAIRVVGFLTAVLGTCAAVPAATWRLATSTRGAVRTAVDRLLRRRKRVTGYGSIAFGGGLASAGNVTPHITVSAAGSLEDRLGRLESRVEEVTNQQARLSTDLRQEADDRKQALRELSQQTAEDVDAVRQLIRDQQRTSEEIDARALPVVLIGAGLTTFPDVLAANAVVGTFAVMVGCSAFFSAWYFVDSQRPAELPRP